MTKDLIIAAASRYTFEKCSLWANSIRATQFSGDVAVVATDVTAETVEDFRRAGVHPVIYSPTDESGNVLSFSDDAPHVERFRLIARYLRESANKYRFVIMTDIRDVVFQSDPAVWLEKNIEGRRLVLSSEQVRYYQEPWGEQNIRETFDPWIYKYLLHKEIYNVGVVAGYCEYVADLSAHIYEMSANRRIKIVDQAVFNYLIHTTPYRDECLYTRPKDGWALQMGTLKETLNGGWGSFVSYYSSRPQELSVLNVEDPEVTGGRFYNKTGDLFCIIHQYDRVPAYAALVERQFAG